MGHKYIGHGCIGHGYIDHEASPRETKASFSGCFRATFLVEKRSFESTNFRKRPLVDLRCKKLLLGYHFATDPGRILFVPCGREQLNGPEKVARVTGKKK